MSGLRRIYADLPRAAKWAVWTGALVAAFLFIDGYVLTSYDRWTAKANLLESELAQLANLGSLESDEGKIIATGITNFGRPSLPGDYSKAAGALTRRVNTVFDNAGIDDRTQIEKSASFKVKATDQRLERIILEVTFEADPRTVTRIVRDLEGSLEQIDPKSGARSGGEVTCVSRVRIDKGGRTTGSSGRVRATITTEAWAEESTSR
jgi:hypothetical protein